MAKTRRTPGAPRATLASTPTDVSQVDVVDAEPSAGNPPPDQSVAIRGSIPPSTLLLIVYATSVCCLVAMSSLISGPFIFGDQAVYFSMARDIAFGRPVSGLHFNPLYSLLISPLLLASDPARTLFLSNIFNALSFSSAIFPFFFIARRLMKDDLRAVAAASAALYMPFGVCSLVTWAEPLYYPLIALAIAVFLRFQADPKVVNALWLGACLPLPFFAKQAGLLLVIAIGTAFAFEFITRPREERFGFVRLRLLALCPALMLSLAWVVRNRHMNQGGGGVGYSEAWTELAGRSNAIGQLVRDCFGNVCHSLVYFSVSLFGVLLIVFVVSLCDWKLLSRIEKDLAIVITAFSALLIALSSVFFSVSGMNARANGRYFDAITPIILLWTFAIVSRDLGALVRRNKYVAFVGVATSVVLTLLFSPLTDFCAYAFVNLPSLSFLNQIFGSKGGIIWSPYGGTQWEKLAVAVAVGLAASLVFVPNKKILLAGVLLLELTASVFAYTNAIRLGRTQNPSNEVYAALIGIGAINQTGLTRPLWIDESARDENTQFFHWFWTGQQPQYVKSEALVSEYGFDFGMETFTTTPGTIKVAAPWRPEGQYIKGIRNGFVDISPLQSTRCKGLGRESDVISSRHPLRFQVDLPTRGRYKIEFEADAQACEASIAPVAFSIASTLPPLHVAGNTYNIQFDVEVREETLQIDLIPEANGFIVLDQLHVIPQHPTMSPIRTRPGSLLLTRRTMPFGKAINNGDLKLYAIN